MCDEGYEFCWMGYCMEAPSCGPGQEVFCNTELDHGMGALECVEKEKPDCNHFLNECSELCNNDVLIAQCWGDPLYAYCKATDGEVFHIHGFSCEHSSCPPDAIDPGCEDGWIHEKDSSDLEPYCYKVLGAEVRDDPQYTSFDQCQQDCNKLGGELASIHSEAENLLIWRNLGYQDSIHIDSINNIPFRKTLIGLKDDKWLDGTDLDYTYFAGEGNSLPETFWDCMFIGGPRFGPLWFTGDCFDDLNKFDCACKKNVQ